MWGLDEQQEHRARQDRSLRDVSQEGDEMKWHKVEAGEYVLRDDNGAALGRVVKTGVNGRDDYPWDWSLQHVYLGVRTTGCTDTMSEARELVEMRLREESE